MLTNLRTEYKTLLFYSIYFITTFIFDKIDRGGPCTPGMGGILFLLSIPISLIYVFVLIYKLYKFGEKQYQNSIFIITAIWILIFFILKYKIL
ncbi:hypothetical protein SAMN06265349_104352 [Flavobacterium resistens]|uniref:Uncharacterized protein n=1 Tax=Flavobacterium resistens TaxID=443612 RepID=A0A521EC61_9FLAO|nr:hypothetical protein SAMN06265349_104352 [Flavobacterium resistens]